MRREIPGIIAAVLIGALLAVILAVLIVEGMRP